MNDYNELTHHGVKGQKWGVRRTAAQLGHKNTKKAAKVKKALKSSTKSIVGYAKKAHANRAEKKHVKELHKKKSPKKMTDAELRERTNRLKLEKEYNDLRGKNKIAKQSASIMSSGAKEVGKVMGNVAKNGITILANHYMGMGLNAIAYKTDPKIAEVLDISVSELNKGPNYKSKNNS